MYKQESRNNMKKEVDAVTFKEAKNKKGHEERQETDEIP